MRKTVIHTKNIPVMPEWNCHFRLLFKHRKCDLVFSIPVFQLHYLQTRFGDNGPEHACMRTEADLVAHAAGMIVWDTPYRAWGFLRTRFVSTVFSSETVVPRSQDSLRRSVTLGQKGGWRGLQRSRS